jgi:outer membrane protein OmpA-like peptidoglycan-associated protein
MRRRSVPSLLAITCLAGALTLAGCATKAQTGAAVGAAGGAAAGGAIGAAAGNTAAGVIIGAVVGGAAGAIIGNEMDKQAAELQQNIPGATVERVGEGIKVTFASGLLFGFDSAELKPEARTNLRNLANSLGEYPGTNILIVGHTDDVGGEQYNIRLSQRRAQSAATYLVLQGVTDNRLDVMGLGETEPVAENATDEGRAQNRRVEIAIYASDNLQDEARDQAGG